MKKILSIIALVSVLVSCNSVNKKSDVSNEGVKTLSLSELVASSGELKDKVVSVTGMVSHVCKHGGQKMFISDDSLDITLLVLVTESIPEFDIALEGSSVEVTGKLVASVVDNMEAEEHEGDAKADEECETPVDTSKVPEMCTTNITYHIEATSYKEIVD